MGAASDQVGLFKNRFRSLAFHLRFEVSTFLARMFIYENSPDFQTGKGDFSMNDKIKAYITTWCPDCTRTRKVLDKKHVDYEPIDIDRDEEAKEYVAGVNNGKHIVPTLLFPDGEILTNPDVKSLKKKLGL